MNFKTVDYKWRHFFDLLIGMTEKELKARYKHTVFGFLWVVVNPLLQMIVIGFVFRLFIKDPIEHYFIYLFAGLLVWNFFSLSLNKATPSIVHERSLIKKSRFPHIIIPLSIILANAVNMFIALLLLAVPTAVMGLLSLIHLPYLFLALTLLIIFTIGISALFCSLNVRFRDITFFVQAALILWFYATPIIYSITIIPYRFMWLWRINPMTAIVQLFQFTFSKAPLPGIGMLGMNSIIIVATIFIGLYVFNKESKYFDDWV